MREGPAHSGRPFGVPEELPGTTQRNCLALSEAQGETEPSDSGALSEAQGGGTLGGGCREMAANSEVGLRGVLGGAAPQAMRSLVRRQRCNSRRRDLSRLRGGPWGAKPALIQNPRSRSWSWSWSMQVQKRPRPRPRFASARSRRSLCESKPAKPNCIRHYRCRRSDAPGRHG